MKKKIEILPIIILPLFEKKDEEKKRKDGGEEKTTEIPEPLKWDIFEI
jgi:hypothetical protein